MSLPMIFTLCKKFLEQCHLPVSTGGTNQLPLAQFCFTQCRALNLLMITL